MGKDPAFPFYASDWLGSNLRAMMSLEQQGAYFTLLCRQWTDPTCSLPSDDHTLARLSELGEGWFDNGNDIIRDCFEPHPEHSERIANKRLLEVRAERDRWSEKSRQGGRRSGAVRRAKAAVRTTSGNVKGGSKGGSPTLRTKREPNANTPSPSPSPSPITTDSSEPSLTASKPGCGRIQMEFPCVGKVKTFVLTASLITTLREAYPDLDRESEYKKAKAWLETNSKRRKTAGGMPKFLNSWFERTQNRGGPTVAEPVIEPYPEH